MKVSIIGASGFAGGEILRIVAAHPVFEVDQLCASSSVGKKLGEFHPQLPQLAQQELKVVDPGSLKDSAVIFLALPHGQSGKIAEQLRAAGVESLLVDCGADHRLTSQDAWDHYYGGEYCGAWTYGMPELQGFGGSSQRQLLEQTKQIAVPGCNVTTVTLAFQPLVAAGLIDPEDIVATLAVGYSGAGKSLKPHLLATSALGNAQPYAVGGTHRHIPEIAQNFAVSSGRNASDYKVTLTPVLVPMSRGILATVTAGAAEKNFYEAAARPLSRFLSRRKPYSGTSSRYLAANPSGDRKCERAGTGGARSAFRQDYCPLRPRQPGEGNRTSGSAISEPSAGPARI